MNFSKEDQVKYKGYNNNLFIIINILTITNILVETIFLEFVCIQYPEFVKIYFVQLILNFYNFHFDVLKML